MTMEPSRRPGANAEAEGAAPNPRTIAILKFVVVSMAILIVAGLGAVIWKIMDLADAPAASTQIPEVNPARQPPGIAAAGPAGALAADIALALPAGAKVGALSLTGSRLAVHFDAPEGPGIHILDLESGRTLSKIRLSPDK